MRCFPRARRTLELPQGHRVLEQPSECRRSGGQAHDCRHRHTAATIEFRGQGHDKETKILGRR